MSRPVPAEDRPPVERTLVEGSDPGGARDWKTVLDGVMGGRSTGSFQREETGLIFQGVLNTNGGGFSSIRRTADDLLLGQPGERGIRLRIRGDGRTYTLRLRQPTGRRGLQASYRASFSTSKGGAWEEAYIPYSDLVPTWRGRSLDLPAVKPRMVDEIGISIDDGIDGPFRIEIGSIGTFGPFAPDVHLAGKQALIVLCTNPSDPRLTRQVDLLREEGQTFAALDSTPVIVHARGGMAGRRPLDSEDASVLFAAFKEELGDSGFHVLLRSKTGHILSRHAEPVSPVLLRSKTQRHSNG